MGFKVRAEGGESVEVEIYDIITGVDCGGISARQVRAKLQACPDASVINLRLNTAGGETQEGFAIANALKEHPARIVAHVDALAASMGSVIAMFADSVEIAPNAMMMVHNPWGGVFGEAKDMRRYADTMDKIRENILDAYESKTGMARDELGELMDAETYMTAEEAVSRGFADSIKGASAPEQRFAALALEGLKAPPSLLRAVAKARRAAPKTPTQHKAPRAQEDHPMKEMLDKLSAAMSALNDGDTEGAMALFGELQEMLEAKEGDSGADPLSAGSSEDVAAMATLMALTGQGRGETVQAVQAWKAQADKAVAQAKQVELSSRRELIVGLIKLGAETPATAWEGDADNRTPCARLMGESVESLRGRVKALGALKTPERVEAPDDDPEDNDGMTETSRALMKKMTPEVREKYMATRASRGQA